MTAQSRGLTSPIYREVSNFKKKYLRFGAGAAAAVESRIITIGVVSSRVILETMNSTENKCKSVSLYILNVIIFFLLNVKM